MAELKTKKNKASVRKFLDSIEDEQQRRDAFALLEMMREVTGEQPSMWGTAIVGFGSLEYRNSSGAQSWFVAGFSPRKQSLTLYLMSGFAKYGALLKKLGKHKTGRACLYVKRLEDVDLGVLQKLIADSVRQAKKLSA